MVTTDLQDRKIEVLFYRAANKKEKMVGLKANTEGFYTVPEKEGYEAVFMSYGFNGAGYYYSKLL